MTEYQHPMRKARLCVYQQVSGDGPAFVAHFEPHKTYPMQFRGDTQEQVTERAEAFRWEAIEKNEAASVARQKALEKARAARKAKEAAA
jgi:hypothetical protein